MKKIAVLGSTGSIGRQTLDVIAKHKEDFCIVALGANSNADLLLKQADEFKVNLVFLNNPTKSLPEIKQKIKVLTDQESFLNQLRQEGVDLLVLALSGISAIRPLFYALEHGIDLAVANKEAIISCGSIINKKLLESSSRLIPLDSEHNALYQLLGGLDRKDIAKIFLTCSGGPFLKYFKKDLEHISVEQALSHPKWEMGDKITIDSATLINKGFEVIEAHYLFNLPLKKIEVLIHPQALIHGIVELKDGTSLAEIAPVSMKVAISYALGYPKRLDCGLRINWNEIKNLNLEYADKDRIKALKICYRVAEKGGSFPAFLIKADEIFVGEFLNRKIKFNQIVDFLDQALQNHNGFEVESVDDVERAFRDAEAVSSDILKEVD
ncbi:MAG TPA: 1-deoxy-D-xylulose-5-phosphate reductoisomerase [Candidatus Omnitrophica bacterium]|nr:1-deoxy-D-xylulose-5-phosphate reductoisomerase [Candidatus Omnitrophota bacterium]